MIRAAVNGAAGRMGQLLVKLICESKEFQLVSALERADHPDLGKDAGTLAGTRPSGIPLSSELVQPVDVLIDFSSPDSTLQRVSECIKKRSPMVIGTTGHAPEGLKRIREASAIVPIVLSPNMSLGVNLLAEVLPVIAKALGNSFDAEIVEAHHRFKKDSPSGTALKLAEAIAGGLGLSVKENAVYGRQGIVGERKRTEIGILAVRAGDIVGEHTVIFGGLGERIEVKHIAQSRECFARGALRAAQFVVAKPPALYTMKDVLAL